MCLHPVAWHSLDIDPHWVVCCIRHCWKKWSFISFRSFVSLQSCSGALNFRVTGATCGSLTQPAFMWVARARWAQVWMVVKLSGEGTQCCSHGVCFWQFGLAHQYPAGGHFEGLWKCSSGSTPHKGGDTDPAAGLMPFYCPVQCSCLTVGLPVSPPCSWDCAGRHNKPSCDHMYGCAILEEMECLRNLIGLPVLPYATSSFTFRCIHAWSGRTKVTRPSEDQHIKLNATVDTILFIDESKRFMALTVGCM